MPSNILGEPLKTVDLRTFGIPIKEAIKLDPVLRSFADEKGRIDLGDPWALREYNKFVFKKLGRVDLFIPEGFLIPTAGLRIRTAKIIKELISKETRGPYWNGIEIGTGATAVNAMLLAREGFRVIATEIDEESFYWAKKNIANNDLDDKILLLRSKGELLEGIVDFSEEFFDFVLTFPPYYDPKDTHLVFKDRGFQGREKELIGGRGGVEFSLNVLSEAISTSRIGYCFIMLDKEFRAEQVFEEGRKMGWDMNWIRFIAGTRIRFFVFGKNPDFYK